VPRTKTWGELKNSSAHSYPRSSSHPGRFIPKGTIPSTHFVEGWLSPRAGPDVEKKGKLLPPSEVEPRYLYLAVGLQVTLRCSVPSFISALPNLSPVLYSAAPTAVYRLWPLWTNCYVSGTSRSKLLGTSSNAAVPCYGSTLILPLVRDTFLGSSNSSCEFRESYMRVRSPKRTL